MLKIVLEVLKCAVIVLGAVSGLIGTFTKNKDKPPGKITLAESTMTRPVADAQKALNLLLGAHATLTAADTSRNGRNPPSHSFLAQQNPAGNKTEVKVGDFPDFSHPRAVSPSSEVSSFELDLFMSQIGAKLPDFFERFAHEPMNQGEDDFRTALGPIRDARFAAGAKPEPVPEHFCKRCGRRRVRRECRPDVLSFKRRFPPFSNRGFQPRRSDEAGFAAS